MHDLILSTLLLSKIDIGLRRFFAKKAQFLNVVNLKMGVAIHFSLQRANHSSQRSDYRAVCKANNGT